MAFDQQSDRRPDARSDGPSGQQPDGQPDGPSGAGPSEAAGPGRRAIDGRPLGEPAAPTRFGQLLDGFATRRALGLSVLLLFVGCLSVVVYIEKAVRSLEINREVFNDRQLRNGFVSMSDVQRVLYVAQDAVTEGGFSEENTTEFTDAVDILFVRKDNFRRVLEAGAPLGTAEAAIASLENIVSIADRHIADGLTDTDALWSELQPAADQTRRALVTFLDDMDTMQANVLVEQEAIVTHQKIVVLVTLGVLSIVSIGALLLLRREVLARTARDRAERNVRYLAYYDPLTRLANRSQFQTRISRCLDQDKTVALMLIDLDDFKGINDTYGHGAGDAVLRHVANILQAHARDVRGFAARLGGDEFAIVAPSLRSDRLSHIADRVIQQTRQDLEIDGEKIPLGLSIGIATSRQICREDADALDALSRIADFALYASKTDGRGRYTIYNQSLEKRFLERRAVINELPRAVEAGELDVWLQPKVTLPDFKPFAFEALARWRRGDAIVPPSDFIGIAEQSGAIFEIDRYVLRQSTQRIAAFNRRNGTRYGVSVNLSAMHFASSRIVDWIAEALTQSGLEPCLLTLEITETVELRDMRQVSHIIERVRNLGARVAIDDFGTGYAALTYLRKTIADEIKIDRSMVEDVETSEKACYLLRGVLTMVRNLELDVVVEGIETQAQAEAVMKMGANRAQGFLFGRPMPMEATLARVEGWRHLSAS